MWFMGRRGKCYASDVPFGINGRRTLPETISFASHGKKVWIVKREKWMRK